MYALILSLVVSAEPAQVAAAKAALGPFKKSLKETLVTALATSPEAAIDVCSKEAPVLAARASTEAIIVGRSAWKLRNPKNAPSKWVDGAMDVLSKGKPGVAASHTVQLDGGRVGYAEPIWVQAECLVCHGEHVAPVLEKKLDAAYPKDAARGFKLGDFRGVFWAEVAQTKR